eukprot:2415336-Heterocapsa_arctica.AAC.1
MFISSLPNSSSRNSSRRARSRSPTSRMIGIRRSVLAGLRMPPTHSLFSRASCAFAVLPSLGTSPSPCSRKGSRGATCNRVLPPPDVDE